MSPFTSSYTTLSQLLHIFLLSDKALCEVKARVDAKEMAVSYGESYQSIRTLPLEHLKELRRAWVNPPEQDPLATTTVAEGAAGSAEPLPSDQAKEGRPGVVARVRSALGSAVHLRGRFVESSTWPIGLCRELVGGAHSPSALDVTGMAAFCWEDRQSHVRPLRLSVPPDDAPRRHKGVAPDPLPDLCRADQGLHVQVRGGGPDHRGVLPPACKPSYSHR
jgi:hypothetical protein